MAGLDLDDHGFCSRCPEPGHLSALSNQGGGLIHHSDRGSQYLSIRYTGRLVEAGIDTSVGSVGDSYDNALAESIIGLLKAEIINFIGFRKTMGQGEWENLQWVNWYNTGRLHSAPGHKTPQEMEEIFHANLNPLDKVTQISNKTLSSKTGAAQCGHLL